MSAEEVKGWLGELLQLSRVANRSEAERERVENLCRLLRGTGCSNQWIEEFTGGRLPVGSIKRWTRGVEVRDTSGKDELMGELREFVEGGHRVSDLAAYADARKIMDGVPMTFAQCAAFVANLMKLEVDPKELMQLSQELADTGLNAKGVARTNELRSQLDPKGLTIEVEEAIYNAANRHGDGEGVLKALAAFENLGSIEAQAAAQKKVSDEYTEKIASQKAEHINMVSETASFRGYVDVAKVIVKHGFDMNACDELLKAAEKSGSAPGTIGAVNAYNSVKEINSLVEAKKAELGAWDAGVKKRQAENASLLSQNAEANQLLGKIAEKYSHSKYLQDIAGVITDPQGARIPGPTLARIGVSFLTGFMMCAEASPDLNKKLLEAVRNNIDYTIANLNIYLRGT